LTKFWDKIAENLAQNLVILYAPALAFWAGGLGLHFAEWLAIHSGHAEN
jgi:hypothetical protein